MKKFLIFILFTCLAEILYSKQSWIDSSRKKLNEAQNDMQRLEAISEFFWDLLYSKPDSALPYAQQGILVARRIKSSDALSIAYNQYQAYASLTGNYPIALQYAFEALKFAEHSGNILYISNSQRGLADIYLVLGDYKRAVFYAEKAKAIFDAHFVMPLKVPKERSDTFVMYSNSLYKLSEAYEKSGQIDSALKYIQLVEFAWSAFNPPWPSQLNTYGNIYSKMGNALNAISYYNKGIKSAIHYGIGKDLIDIYNGLANTYKNLRKFDSSIYYSNLVLENIKAIYYPIAYLQAITLLSDSYKAQNKIDSMAKYFELALTVKDSLFNQGKLAQMQSLAFNEQLRQQDMKEEQQKRIYRYRLFALIGGLAVLAVMILILYRNNKQKLKAKIKIEQAYSELKATQNQLIQREKMASLGELTAGIAHEIQNPLNFVNNFSEVNIELAEEAKLEMDKGNTNEVRTILNDIGENEEKINHHGRRADAIVKNMLQHSRSTAGSKEPTDINALADEYLRLAYNGLRAKDKDFNAVMQTHFDKTLRQINIIPQDIGRVLLNIYTNGFYAISEKKKQLGKGYEPTVSVSTKKINSKIEIRVKDNGNGIPEKVLDKIFQPFFTTKPTGQGTGLGLSLSYDIVKAHGGELKVETKEGEGTEFIIQLPGK